MTSTAPPLSLQHFFKSLFKIYKLGGLSYKSKEEHEYERNEAVIVD